MQEYARIHARIILKNLTRKKKPKHKPSGYYSRITCCSFDKSKTKWNYYRGKDCMKRFCKDLKD